MATPLRIAPPTSRRKRPAPAKLTLAQARAQLVRDVATFVASHPTARQALFGNMGATYDSKDGTHRACYYEPTLCVDRRADETGEYVVLVDLLDDGDAAADDERGIKAAVPLRTRGVR